MARAGSLPGSARRAAWAWYVDGAIGSTLQIGPTNGTRFRSYVNETLVPVLQPGDIVVMDNLPAHKVAGVQDAIEAAGARLLYLPSYSPDFNPIEQAFANACAPPRHRVLCPPT